MYGYGEDALTLWALKEELQQILYLLEDKTNPEECIIFYRPSFGRAGGRNSPQFGEFDFIISADNAIYLGESKWDRSSERIVKGTLSLRDAQCQRHNIFKYYINQYRQLKRLTQNSSPSTDDFVKFLQKDQNIPHKLITNNKSLLAENLTTVLNIIDKNDINCCSSIKNILLYFHNKADNRDLPQNACGLNNQLIFDSVVRIDYSTAKIDNFIEI